MFKPKTLAKAYFLAKLQEITMATLRDQPKLVTRTPNLRNVHESPSVFINNTQPHYKLNSPNGLLPMPNQRRLPPNPIPLSNPT